MVGFCDYGSRHNNELLAQLNNHKQLMGRRMDRNEVRQQIQQIQNYDYITLLLTQVCVMVAKTGS
jgi:hypothetical protein